MPYKPNPRQREAIDGALQHGGILVRKTQYALAALESGNLTQGETFEAITLIERAYAEFLKGRRHRGMTDNLQDWLLGIHGEQKKNRKQLKCDFETEINEPVSNILGPPPRKLLRRVVGRVSARKQRARNEGGHRFTASCICEASAGVCWAGSQGSESGSGSIGAAVHYEDD